MLTTSFVGKIITSDFDVCSIAIAKQRGAFTYNWNVTNFPQKKKVMPPRERVRKSFCKMIYEIASYNFITLRLFPFSLSHLFHRGRRRLLLSDVPLIHFIFVHGNFFMPSWINKKLRVKRERERERQVKGAIMKHFYLCPQRSNLQFWLIVTEWVWTMCTLLLQGAFPLNLYLIKDQPIYHLFIIYRNFLPYSSIARSLAARLVYVNACQPFIIEFTICLTCALQKYLAAGRKLFHELRRN
jgi:hypothetical protein